jgi:hypothetical protein
MDAREITSPHYGSQVRRSRAAPTADDATGSGDGLAQPSAAPGKARILQRTADAEQLEQPPESLEDGPVPQPVAVLDQQRIVAVLASQVPLQTVEL